MKFLKILSAIGFLVVLVSNIWSVSVFGTAFLAGMAPTMIANAVNAGSRFATTYGSVDAVPPELNPNVVLSYLVDAQFTLLAISAARTPGCGASIRGEPDNSPSCSR